MPIIIEENQTQSDLQQQVSALAVNPVTMKFFSNQFTGAPNRASGFFNKDANTIIDSLNKNSIDMLKDMNQSLRYELLHPQTSTFRATKSTPEQSPEYVKHTHLQLMPVLLSHLHQAVLALAELTFSGKTPVLAINQIGTDGWDTIDSPYPDHTIAVKVFVSRMAMFGKHISAAKTGTGVSKNYTQTVPELFVAFARYDKNISDIRDESIKLVSRFSDKPSGNELTIAPISMTQDVRFDTITNTYTIDFTGSSTISQLNEPFLCNLANIGDLALLNPIWDTSMSGMLNDQATTVSNQAGTYIFDSIAAILSQTKTVATSSIVPTASQIITSIVAEMENLALFKTDIVSTQDLTSIYQLLRAHDATLGFKNVNNITRQSLRLLLSQRLHELDALKSSNSLYKTPTPSQDIVDAYQKSPNYSIQQKRIILTDEPLVIGQAGAGSGKSHTLIGRIKFLEESGEDLSKMLVLSFTNVAAKNINNRFADVKSETLANMFNKIYQNTYPSQELSQPTTVANSLRLLTVQAPYFQNLNVDLGELETFKNRLATSLSQLDQQGFKKVNIQEVTRDLSNMISEHLDFTTILLDAIEQTTLELEPIIIHNALINDPDALSIPKEYQQLNYIVTDESQDISTFEYILLLELSIHYNAQLIIIGDGSQTLYEFRNSDPTYLNALEASNVFKAYKLDINYRSSQEILSYANQFLDVIDANDIAQIQLTANNMTPISRKSFKKAVTVHDAPIASGNARDVTQELESYFESEQEITSWLLPKLHAGEQVAIMAWTKRELEAVENALQELMSQNGINTPITNITSNNKRPLTLISDTIVFCRDEIYATPTANAQTIVPALKKTLNDAIKRRYTKASKAQCDYFTSVMERAIIAVTTSPGWRAVLQGHQKGTLPSTSLFGYFTKGMLKYETTTNATEQFLRKNDEVPNYDDCKIIISTIHGAKGLEFQHSIVLFNERRKGSTSQESLRMYFVALSRAKESELIINVHAPSQVNARMFTSAQHAMFETPMHTAYLRVMDEIDKQTATTIIATP